MSYRVLTDKLEDWAIGNWGPSIGPKVAYFGERAALLIIGAILSHAIFA